MKKFTTVLLLLITVFLIGCDKTTSTTISSMDNQTTAQVNLELMEAIEYLKAADSVTMESTTSSDVTEDIVVITLIEGMFSSSTIVGIPGLNQYNIEKEGIVYLLQRPGDVYVPIEYFIEEVENPLDILLSEDGYDMSDFILEDEYYIFQSDDESEMFSIKVVDGVIQEVQFGMTEDGIDFHFTVTLSHYNNTSVNLPSNMVDLELYFNALNSLSDYDVSVGDDGIWFIKDNISVECNATLDSCNYEGPPLFVYNVNAEIFQLDDMALTIDQLYLEYPDLAISKTDLRNMIVLYNLVF